MPRPNRNTARAIPGLSALALLAACSGTPSLLSGSKSGDSSENVAARAANAGDYNTAAELYQAAYEKNPRSTDALVGLGRSYTGLGQHNRAEQALLKAAEQKPRDTEVLLELGRTQLAAGKPAAALQTLEKAHKKTGNKNLQVITAHGIALDRLSRHTEAQAVYREGLSRSPTDFALLSNLGLSLGLSGQTDEGIRILRELVRDSAASSHTRGNLALVYGLAGREKDARATLATDLSSSQVNSNIAYYRELRGLLAQGKPIGSLQ